MTDFLRDQRSNGIVLSVLFSIPGFILSMVATDHLHTLDLGVTQEALGNLIFVFLYHPLCEGKNRAEKI